MKRALILILALLATAVGPSCASDDDGSSSETVKQVMVETDRPIEVSSLSRTIRVEVGEEGTILHLGRSRIACPGYRGYAGRIGTTSGWVRVGALDFSYDRQNVRVRSKSRWTNMALSDSLNVVIEQNGSVGRSIFTD